jgi:ATP-dependent helicase/nuclease subunit B
VSNEIAVARLTDGSMAVQFILGRSGTGKTAHCIRAVTEALLEPSADHLLLLVPEQATYQAERAVLSDGRIKGYHRLHIVSFDRLQFMLLGKNTARPLVSRLGRQMIVHKILRDVREELTVFRSSASLPGFARQVAETIAEMYQYARTADDLANLSARLPTDGAGRLAAMKFADISRIFHAYMQYLEGRFADPDAQIVNACEKVQDADFLKGARLWVDGFSGFTDGEMALLTEVLKRVNQSQIALSMDPDRAGGGRDEPSGAHADDIFEPTEQTYQSLLELIRQAKIEIRDPILLRKVGRFSKAPALAHLECNLFRSAGKRVHADGTITLISAPSLRAEVQTVARRIVALVKDKGYRYRDIAVVASDLNRYEHYIRGYFDDYQVPFFIDKRKPLSRHPVIELLGAALAAVTEGFGRDDVFAYLKTDLAPLNRDQVDMLENYCLAFGLDSRDWTDSTSWRFQGEGGSFDEEQIGAIRDRAVMPLLELREGLCPDDDGAKTLTASDFVTAIFTFLDHLDVRSKVARWIEEARQAGDLAAVEEHQQFLDRLVDVFDELIEVFGADRLQAADFRAILNLAFSQMTLAFIPPSLDQVLVGSIERSRHPNLKAVFLLGATQKEFPIPVVSGGVLSDEDREAAETAGFRLAPSSTQSLIERAYLAYIAYTRPSELLCISYPGVDEKGGPLVRSHFVDELVALFDDLTEQSVEDTQLQVEDIHEPSEMAEWLCSRLGRDVFAPQSDAAPLKELLDAMRSDGDYRLTAVSIMSALRYQNHAVLDPSVVQRLVADRVPSSATQLETFAACPFKHFAHSTLRLRPRREFKLEPLDLGEFYHAVLDALHKALVTEDSNFAEAEDARLMELLGEQIDLVVAQKAFIAKFKAHSAHNAFILQNAGAVLEECVLDIAQMSRAGAFRPFASEMGFGDVREAQQSLGAFEMNLSGGRILSLNGKIDRIDLAHVGDKKVALILDYKTSTFGAKLHWWKLYHGLALQLPLYTLAVLSAHESVADHVAGAVCMPIEVPLQAGELGESQGEPQRFHRKARGLIDGAFQEALDRRDSGSSPFYSFRVTKEGGPYGDYNRQDVLKAEEFRSVLDWMRRKIIALAEDRVSGRIEVKPYRYRDERPCTYCDYLPVCRFDWQINDYHYLDPKAKGDVVTEASKK